MATFTPGSYDEVRTFLDGLEGRLAKSMQKALDIVTSDLNARLTDMEKEQARIVRHLGLDHKPTGNDRQREIV